MQHPKIGGWRGNKPPSEKGIKPGAKPKDDTYWARLRKEFETCTYPNSGAYGQTETRTRAKVPLFEQRDRFGNVIK